MKMKKKLVVLSLFLVLLATACGKQEAKQSQQASTTELSDNKIVIGVSPVPHQEIVENVLPQLKEAGLDVELVTFEDYVQPNLQLESKDLDANYFQHEPYLKDFCEEHKITDLVSLGFVHTEPMAFYSKQYKDIKEIPDGAEIIIPNDATNGARALILLENAGLIKLKDNKNFKATEKDIAENPKQLKIVAMDAPNIPRSYAEAQGAVINSNYALGAGLDPSTDSIFIEAKDSPYANLVAIRKEDADKPKFKKLIEVLQSEDTKKFIQEKYKGAILPAF